jgi:hypothetical protein
MSTTKQLGKGKIYICVIPGKGIDIIQPRKDAKNVAKKQTSNVYNKLCSKLGIWKREYGLASSFPLSIETSIRLTVHVYNKLKLFHPEEKDKAGVPTKLNLINCWHECHGVANLTKAIEFVGAVRNPIDEPKHKKRTSYIVNLDDFSEMGTDTDLINLVKL